MHQGKPAKARKLLELVPDKLDTTCWNAMMVGYAKKEWENEFGNAVFREDGGEECCFLEFSYYSACVNLVALQELCSEELSSCIDKEDVESELLLHFLISSKEQKQSDASKLFEQLKCLESDIEEAERRHSSRKSFVSSGLQNNYSCQKEIMPLRKELLSVEMLPTVSPISNTTGMRLMRGIGHLESAYFSMRSKVQLSETGATVHPGDARLSKMSSHISFVHQFRKLAYACIRFGQFDSAKETFEVIADYEGMLNLFTCHLNPSAMRRIARKLEDEGLDSELRRYCERILRVRSSGWTQGIFANFAAESMVPKGPEWGDGEPL
ncbi:hypothetical protein KIW84_051851 [Lathyrus oleraceus]|uniref:Uncharacterized protein n=1 Tax=Pisum sativum TaxID=3888 RepID=A0A9D4WNQ7_PEA|nr:hypothetical protein KIW84_051851 [Pisum sativum]